MIRKLGNYDIIILTETWAGDDNQFDNLFQSHRCFAQTNKKASKHGHTPGGINVYVKEELCQGVERIHDEQSLAVVLKLDAQCFGLTKDILLFAVYVPPENSVFYDRNEETNGIDILESLIDKSITDDSYVCVIGDMNARTGFEPDFLLDDNADYLPCEDSYS